MLRLSLIGNLGRDPEERFTADGRSVVTFSVAVNQVKTGNGERKERTDWFRVRTAGAKAEFVTKYLRKGSRVLVVGRLEIDEYVGRDEAKHLAYDVWADEIQDLSPRGSAEGSQPDGTTNGAAAAPARAAVASSGGARPGQRAVDDRMDLEDLPF